MTTRLEQATKELLARRNSQSHPEGEWDGPRWWPSADEEHDCCWSLETPSTAWPGSMMLHCRTIVHVAQLFNVDESELRRAVRQTSKTTELPSPPTCPVTTTLASGPELGI